MKDSDPQIRELEDEIFELRRDLEKWRYMLKDYRRNQSRKQSQTKPSLFDFLARRPPPHEPSVLNQIPSPTLQIPKFSNPQISLPIPQPSQQPGLMSLVTSTQNPSQPKADIDNLFSSDEESQQSYSENEQPVLASIESLAVQIDLHNREVKNIPFNKTQIDQENQNIDQNIMKYFPKSSD